MKTLTTALCALGALPLAGHELATDYTRERTLRIDARTEIALETTSMEMLVDGEPRDRPFGGLSVKESRHVVLLDRHLEHGDGGPIRVRRTFDTIERETSMSFGEGGDDTSSQGPLAGVVLELTVDEDGDVTADVVEGDEPDDDALLEGHVLTLCLDAFLPAEEVDEGDSWDLDSEAVAHALGLALSEKLFPAPEREAREAGAGRGEGGGRRGMGRRGGSAARFLQDAEWEGTATLETAEEEHEGQPCVVITLELEASGELPETGGFGGGGRRERGFALASGVRRLRDSSFEVELEGRLLFSHASGRPVLVELEGTLSTERFSEFERQGRTMSMNSTQAGTFEQTISLSEE